MSLFQDVASSCDLPSLSPRGGSSMTKSIKMTATMPAYGVTRNPHCQPPNSSAVSDPTM